MPLNIDVGLSRKLSRDYQSRGASINLATELDPALLSRPDQLQQRIADLYAQADAALQHQLEHGEPAGPPGDTRQPRHRNGHARRRVQAMTPAQRHAIERGAQRLGVDPDAVCHEAFGWRFQELTTPQASRLIDHLRDLDRRWNGSGA